jgi:hypothetical protein
MPPRMGRRRHGGRQRPSPVRPYDLVMMRSRRWALTVAEGAPVFRALEALEGL